ncbi:late embryogenesis abundant protein D-34-like [Quillaja saponaria]|uniref:Late embryogenesis abundant protein D-34-like n=1 Tax=Quillaja saponaria TaxID=32244 RepID=A0AAD7Q248_QUISA|nr:late embryogenesis abundant protein D-34-like [Quillaja saponaria]
MSQEQPRRPQQEPIKYGDVFNVQGELAGQPVAPKDAAMMQTAENAMLGQTQKGGAASIMQSAAMKNEKAGFVGHADITGAAGDCGVVGQYSQRTPLVPPPTMQPGGVGGDTGITIGEALEATALTAGRKPVEWSDAAAIQAAEVRATGRTNIVPGGVAAAAQSAATLNARATRDEDKTKLGDILADATSKLPSDRPATRRDAEGVTGAEMRNDPQLITHPTGVAASVAAAARLNQNTTTNNKTSN